MKAAEKELLLIRINDSYGFDSTLYNEFKAIIEEHKPLHYDFMNPGTFMIYFPPHIEKSILDSFLNNIKNKFQYILESDCERLEKASISQTTSEFTGEIEKNGNFKFPVFGGSEIYKKNNIIWRNYTENFGILKTHKNHIENMINILTINESIHVLNVEIQKRKYDFSNVITYLSEMYGFCDFNKIITYGIGFITDHLDLILLLLQKNSVYIFDDKMHVELKKIINAIKSFLNEYKLDQSRHAIYYPDRLNEIDYETNAYDINEVATFEIYQKFSEYISYAINEYIKIKEMFISILNEFKSSQYSFSINNLEHEIIEFSEFTKKLQLTINIIKNHSKQEKEFIKLKDKILGEIEQTETLKNSFYKGIDQLRK